MNHSSIHFAFLNYALIVGFGLCAACSSNQDSGPWELGEDAGGDVTTDMNVEEDMAPLIRVYAITDFSGGYDYWGIRASSNQECLNVVLVNPPEASPFEIEVSPQSVESIFIEHQACVAGAPMHKHAPETALGATSAVGSIEIFEDYISADLTIEFEGRPAVMIQESQIEFE